MGILASLGISLLLTDAPPEADHLALGASAVGIGRPYAYGLALGGVDGIVHVLRSLLAEADLIMAVDGYPTLADLTPDALRGGLGDPAVLGAVLEFLASHEPDLLAAAERASSSSRPTKSTAWPHVVSFANASSGTWSG